MACWSREFTAEFIDLYRSQESVWNVKSKDYTDRAKKAKGYELLVTKVQTVDRNATRDTVVKKINCLRSSFRKEVKKVVKSKQAQAGDGQVYVPRLWYYNRLAFLEGHELPRDSNTDNEEDEDPEDKEPVIGSIEGVTFYGFKPMEATGMKHLESNDRAYLVCVRVDAFTVGANVSVDLTFGEIMHFQDYKEDAPWHNHFTSTEPDVECETVINVKRPRSPADESSASSIPINDVTRRRTKRRKCSHQQQHSVQQQDNSYAQLVTEDRFDICGKIVASKLRSLPNEQRIYAEKLINDVLFEAELNTLGRGCHIVVPRTIQFPSGNSDSVCG